MRPFSVFPQCQGRSFSYDSTFLTMFFSSSSPSTAPNGRRTQPKVLRFSLKEPRSTLFPHTQLLLRTTKHPKTFGFPSRRFSSSSPSTPPMAVERNKVSCFFPTTKHEVLKGSSFDFQIPGANHLRMFCKDLTIIPYPCHLSFMPLVPRHKKMTHHSCNVVVIHVGLANKHFPFYYCAFFFSQRIHHCKSSSIVLSVLNIY